MTYYQLTLDEIAKLTNQKRPKKFNRKSKYMKEKTTKLQKEQVAINWFQMPTKMNYDWLL